MPGLVRVSYIASLKFRIMAKKRLISADFSEKQGPFRVLTSGCQGTAKTSSISVRKVQVMDTMLSIREVAERYGVHPRTVRRWITGGHLKADQVGPKLIRIDPMELHLFSRPAMTQNDYVRPPSVGHSSPYRREEVPFKVEPWTRNKGAPKGTSAEKKRGSHRANDDCLLRKPSSPKRKKPLDE